MTCLFNADKQANDRTGESGLQDRRYLPLNVLASLCPEWMAENRNPQSRYLACGQLFGNMGWLEDILFLATDDITPSASQTVAIIDSGFWPIAHDAVQYLLIHHDLASLDKPEGFLEEAVRVLDPAGTILVICPYRRWFWAQKMRTLPLSKRAPALRANAFLAKSQIIKMMADAGLDIVQMRHSRYHAGSSNGKLSRFVGTARYHQQAVLIIQARKRLYAPLKSNYAYSRRRFSLGKMVPAGLAADDYKRIGRCQ
jgi:hypothetical protein